MSPLHVRFRDTAPVAPGSTSRVLSPICRVITVLLSIPMYCLFPQVDVGPRSVKQVIPYTQIGKSDHKPGVSSRRSNEVSHRPSAAAPPARCKNWRRGSFMATLSYPASAAAAPLPLHLRRHHHFALTVLGEITPISRTRPCGTILACSNPALASARNGTFAASSSDLGSSPSQTRHGGGIFRCPWRDPERRERAS